MKRIVFAEYFDHFDFGKKFQEWLGIEASDDEVTEEKLGSERFGSNDIFKSFGVTFILIAAFLVLLIAIFLFMYWICRKTKCSHISSEKVGKIKEKLLYNPLI